MLLLGNGDGFSKPLTMSAPLGQAAAHAPQPMQAALTVLPALVV